MNRGGAFRIVRMKGKFWTGLGGVEEGEGGCEERGKGKGKGTVE